MSSPVAQRWSALLDEAAASGLSLRAFARARRVNPSTLAWWRWHLGRSAGSSRPNVAFLEVTVADASEPEVVLELPRVAARIRVDPRTDLALLRRLVDALC
jgi:hypothetical protein